MGKIATKSSTGKSLGFKVGDFIWTGAFPGIIISDVGTYAPCCEVWGWKHEMGSAYATDLRKISFEEFKAQAQGFDGTAYSKASKKAIAEAEAKINNAAHASAILGR
jgi:hypothetical protein